MPRLLRRNGRIVAHPMMYTSDNARNQFGVVFMKGSTYLPKTAKKVQVSFYDKRGKLIRGRNTMASKSSWVNAKTARKLDLF